MVGGIKQINLVVGDQRQPVKKFLVHINVAGRARSTTTAKCEQFVKSRMADRFHHRSIGAGRNVARDALSGGYDNLDHIRLRSPMGKRVGHHAASASLSIKR